MNNNIRRECFYSERIKHNVDVLRAGEIVFFDNCAYRMSKEQPGRVMRLSMPTDENHNVLVCRSVATFSQIKNALLNGEP